MNEEDALRRFAGSIITEYGILPLECGVQDESQFIPSGPVIEGSIEPDEADIDKLKATLERCGYQVILETPEYEKLARQAFTGPISGMLAPPPPRMIIYLPDGAVSCDVQKLETSLRVEFLGVVQSILTHLAPGQQHVCCASCHEPLLRAVAGSGKGEGATHWYMYRSVKAGPRSPALSTCPGCQAVLSEQAVKEIADV